MESSVTEAKSAESFAAASFVRTLLTPLCVLSPASVARSMCALPRRSFVLVFLVYCGLFATSIVIAVLLDETITYAGTRSARDVWQSWHVNGSIGLPEWTLLVCIMFLPVLTAVGAWIFLPAVQGTDGAWTGYRRAYRAVAAGIGLLTMLTAAIGILIAWVSNMREQSSIIVFWASEGWVMLGIPYAANLLIWWLTLAARGAAGDEPSPPLAPVCEGCGYDLTHQAAEGRCTECGMEVRASLEPALRRTGCAWEASPGVASFLATVSQVTLNPSRFYGALRLRARSDNARMFSTWNFIAISCGGAVWACACASRERYFSTEEVVLAAAFTSALTPLIGWMLHRVIAALAYSWWLYQRALRDVRWFRKVVAYESAFLWVPCAYSGMTMTSFFVLGGNWMTSVQTDLLGHRISFFGGMPLEPLALLLGNLGLCVVWLLRYRVILRAVRWSNF